MVEDGDHCQYNLDHVIAPTRRVTQQLVSGGIRVVLDEVVVLFIFDVGARGLIPVLPRRPKVHQVDLLH